MWQHQEALEQLEVTVLPISFQRLPSIALPSLDDPPPVDYFIDPEKTLYHHYGMFSAGFWDIWGPATWIAYLKLLARGEKLRKSEGDLEQRGGDVLIDPDGIIRLHHIGNGPADRPEVEKVLAMIRKPSAV